MGRGQGQNIEAMATRRPSRYQQARRAAATEERAIRASFPERLAHPPASLSARRPDDPLSRDEALFLAAMLDTAAKRLQDSSRRRQEKFARRDARRAAAEAAAA